MPVALQTRTEELIADEVKEIISYRPHWVIRKGNTFFFGIIMLLLGGAWLIRYPDTVSGSARLVALNVPKMIHAPTSGKLARLLISNEQLVRKDQHLGYLESTASYVEVMALKNWIEATMPQVQNGKFTTITANPLPQLTSLGEVQSSYQEFQNTVFETRQVLANGYYQMKEQVLQKDLRYLALIKAHTRQQQTLLDQDRQMQDKEVQAYEQLARDKIIAPLELNQYKSKLIAKEQSLQQVQVQLTNGELSSIAKQKELLELQKFERDQKQKFYSELLNLKSDVEKWITQFVLLAPEGGKVMFVSPLQENMALTSGEDLFYVQSTAQRYYSEVMVAQKGFGKIEVGQKVIIKTDSYPAEEYGHLDGIVTYLNHMPGKRDSFFVRVALPHGLKTNQHKELYFRNNLSAKAEIIIANRRLFQRLFGRFAEMIR